MAWTLVGPRPMRHILFLTLVVGLLSSSLGFNVFLDEPDTSEDQFLVSYDDDTVEWDEDGSSHTEDQYQSLSRFWILTEDEETFSSPVVEVVGSNDPKKLKDDTVSIIYHGDAAYGTLQDDYDDDIDSDYLPMSLWVVYVCQQEGEALIKMSIDVSPSLDSNDTRKYVFVWTKKCGAQIARRGFHVYREYDPDPVVESGVVLYPWRTTDQAESDLLEVPYSEGITTFYVVVDRGSQVFLKPTLSVSPPGSLKVSVHGVSEDLTVVEQTDEDSDDDMDSFVTEDRTWIHVYYDGCTDTDVPYVMVTMHIAVPPFNPLDVSWRKSCGGGAKRSFYLSSTRANRGDIVTDGVVNPSWSSPLSTDLKVIPVDQDKTTFYMVSGPGETPSKVIVTSQDSIGVGSVVSAAATVDSSSNPNKITVSYSCKQRGEATLCMMIPVPQHDPLRVYWKKRCPIYRAPDYQPEQEEAYWTANQLLVLFCFMVAAAVGVAGYLYLRVKKNRRMRQMQLAQEQMG